MCSCFLIYVGFAIVSSLYYSNLRIWVQRVHVHFIPAHVWALTLLNFISFRGKTLSCPQTTDEGLKCVTAILLGVYVFKLLLQNQHLLPQAFTLTLGSRSTEPIEV